jgi:cyclopropane fatty-acyl-phospholipid synthase-like methyltransferase
MNMSDATVSETEQPAIAVPTSSTEAAAVRAAEVKNSYDLLPGEPRPLQAAQVDALAVTAALAGLRVAPAGRCRVLEIGCGVGGNLLPMAQVLPQSTFVGIDLSGRQITAARRRAAGAELRNVRLEARSFTTVDVAGFGEFDYIIAHGIYSWVPVEVRDRLLDAIARLLAPEGVAYINYHVYPGWYGREMFRDVLASATRNAAGDPRGRAAEARRIMGMLEQYAKPGAESPYAAMLRQEAAFLASAPEDFIVHDYLEASSQGIYFEQFVDRLWARGLEYAGEIKQNPGRRKLLDQLAVERPELAADWRKLEQWVDYVLGAVARRSLICRAGRSVARSPQIQAVEGLHARALAVPAVGQADLNSSALMPFRLPDGGVLQIGEPMIKAVLISLARAWPGAVSFEALLQIMRSTLPIGGQFAAPGNMERAMVLQALSACYVTSLIELHDRPPEFVTIATEKPKATPLARFQVRESKAATNAMHYLVPGLNKLDRVVLTHLNGTRDRAALMAVLKAAIAKGVLPDPKKDRAAASEAGFGTGVELEAVLEQSLAKLAAAALLVE